VTWYDALLRQMAARLFSLDVNLVAYPLVFTGGLLTNFCPCNVVLVSMMIGYVGGFSRSKERGRALLYSSAFAAGIVVTLCGLGLLVSALGALLSPIRSVCLWLIAVIAVLMGLYCLEVVSFRLPGLGKLPMMEGLKGRGVGGRSCWGWWRASWPPPVRHLCWR